MGIVVKLQEVVYGKDLEKLDTLYKTSGASTLISIRRAWKVERTVRFFLIEIFEFMARL